MSDGDGDGEPPKFTAEFVKYREWESVQTGWFAGLVVVLGLAHFPAIYTPLSYSLSTVILAVLTCLIMAGTDDQEKHMRHAHEDQMFKEIRR